MSERKKTIRINVIMVSVTLLVLLISITGNAKEKQFHSQGKIVFDNKTEDAADDVIFDAGDFNRLAVICQ
ncbi:MAG: hypothetical protein K1W30_00165 [Lachnospiraceae bacterium]|mgnify:CR=1 FL=1